METRSRVTLGAVCGGVVVLLVMVLAGASGGTSAKGPLGALGGGTIAMTPSPGMPDWWSGSFSGLPLCLEDTSSPASITGVNILDTTGNVSQVEVMAAVPLPGREVGNSYAVARGTTPEFAEKYAARNNATKGYAFPALEGLKITTGCDDHRKVPLLVINFATGPSGGRIDGWEVLYEVAGRKYTTGPVPWEMVLCGNDPQLLRDCTF